MGWIRYVMQIKKNARFFPLEYIFYITVYDDIFSVSFNDLVILGLTDIKGKVLTGKMVLFDMETSDLD